MMVVSKYLLHIFDYSLWLVRNIDHFGACYGGVVDRLIVQNHSLDAAHTLMSGTRFHILLLQ